MSLRLFVLVILLGTVLAGCVTASGGDDLDRMQRNQDAARETAA
jgi:predicted small secreted protein